MSKIETSMKITKRFSNVFRCGYCDLQDIYRWNDPTYYNAGVYGWNCDLYVDYKTDTIITTGYRNMRGARIPDAIIKKYSKKAKEIHAQYPFSATYEETLEKSNNNIDEFIKEVLEEIKRNVK